VLGEAQSGSRSHLRLLSLLQDKDVIEDPAGEAIDLIGRDPDLDGHPALAQRGRRAGHRGAGRVPGEGLMTRIVAGSRTAVAALQPPSGLRHPAHRPTGCARRCSPHWSR
jgi:hypothetical protein